MAVAALLALSATTRITTGWLYDGGLPAVSLLWCLLVAAATVPGPVTRLLAVEPAVAVGRRSYGMYVYHWPIFLVAARLAPGASAWALVPAELVLTAAVAWASFRWLEEPIRAGRRPAAPARARPALAMALTAIGVAVVLVPAHEELRFPEGPTEEVGVVAFRAGDEPPAVELDVLVVGSESPVAAWVARAEVPGARLDVRTALRPGCPLLVPDGPAPGCPSHAEAIASGMRAGPPDLVVLAVGAADRAALHGEGAPQPGASPTDVALWSFAKSREILHVLVAGLPDVPTLIVDTAVAPADALATVLDGYALVHRDTVLAATADPAAVAGELEGLAGLTSDVRRRLLVIGDSTSFELAQALDGLAGERFDIVWAGALNCPLPPVTELRWQRDMRFPRDECPTTSRHWPDVVADFRPEAVLGIWSIPELSEQRYPDDDEWHEPGEEAYVRAHDDAMAALQALLAPTGAVTIVATSPPFAEVAQGVADFGGGPLGEPERLAAWQAQVARWDSAWHSVAVLDWAGLVVEAERAAGRSLRGDGLHLDPGAVNEWMAPQLVAALDAALAAADTDASASGCRSGLGADRVLDLARCRTAGQ
jgi:hypothetical protein